MRDCSLGLRRQGLRLQDGRPALVVSNNLFNKHTGLCIACRITKVRRDYPFHVSLPDGCKVTGVVMVEQVKSIDFRALEAKRIGPAPEAVLQEALSLLDAWAADCKPPHDRMHPPSKL